MEALIKIQSELNAPKNLYNSFGKYKYRSAESILEAVKPLLKKYNCQMTITDDVLVADGRYYIKATATITNGEETVSVCAFAREDAEKKGMDGAQLTGATSSYARKYALNGLFLIDDAKDPDTDEYEITTQKRATKTEIGSKQNALAEIKSATDKNTLIQIWQKYAHLQTDADFSKQMSARRKELNI